MSELTQDACWTCNGSGRLRNNASKNGTYTFGKIECSDCGGSGVLDYLTCDDCGAVVPAYLIGDHDCDD